MSLSIDICDLSIWNSHSEQLSVYVYNKYQQISFRLLFPDNSLDYHIPYVGLIYPEVNWLVTRDFIIFMCIYIYSTLM
jgi:hypothetical protein